VLFAAACSGENSNDYPVALTAGVPNEALTANGGYFALTVKDLDAMAAWYQKTFDMRIIITTPDGKVMLLQGNGYLIELRTSVDTNGAVTTPNSETPKLFGASKVGLIVNDLDGFSAVLKDRKVQFTHDIYGTPAAIRTFSIQDPEGNTIQFFGK
jgi:catechol-2,3-dioxygenase